MFQKIFNRKGDSATPEDRLKRISASTSAKLAAEMLRTPTALMQLGPEEAQVVVSYMQPMRIPEGETFISEGDHRTDFMILVLEGDVTVESITVSRVSPVTLTVLGPGSLIGEMGLVDGEPRSASCTASTDLRCASLSREGLEDLINDDPRTGAKLMMAISLRIAARMRDTADKLKLYSQLTQAMQQEIDTLMPTP